MRIVKIELNGVNKVKDFSNMVHNSDLDIDLANEKYIVDAKSIMGIFSLDLTKPLSLRIHSEDTVKIESFLDTIKDFIVER